MIDTSIKVLSIINHYTLYIIIFVFMILLLAVLIKNITQKEIFSEKLFNSIIIALVTYLFLLTIFSKYGEYSIQNKTVTFLKNNENSKVYVNGKVFEKSAVLIDELINIKNPPAHNSSHTKHEFVVEIKTEERNLQLLLIQDDERQREYWVYSKYITGKKIYIGRINTDIFDIYTNPKGTNFY